MRNSDARVILFNLRKCHILLKDVILRRKRKSHCRDFINCFTVFENASIPSIIPSPLTAQDA